MFGNQGNDSLDLAGNNNTVFAGAGDDTVNMVANGVLLFGNEGADVLNLSTSGSTIVGGNDLADGDDNVTATGDGNFILTNGGADTITAAGNALTIVGGFGDDVVSASGIAALIFANQGSDTVTAGDGADTIFAGIGDDSVRAGDGADTLFGNEDNDTIVGGRGDDAASLGEGNDLFVWNPGEGSDTVEGDAGDDVLDFNGADVNEVVSISANGTRTHFLRDVADITMDLNRGERISFDALGGSDDITVNDLTSTGVMQVDIDLGVAGEGDSEADRVTVNATAGGDVVNLAASGSVVSVVGVAAGIGLSHAEGGEDVLTLNALGGADTINASVVANGVIGLVFNGGTGADSLVGSQGGELLDGGDQNDTIVGGRGDDAAQLGAGDDVFVWNPGDGSDLVEGGAGTADTLLFNGANVAEHVDISANAGRIRFFRDVANVTMDVNDVERISFHALGGVDNIVIGDLSGTDMARIDIDLGAAGGGGDGAADNVTVSGTQGDDVLNLLSSSGVVSVRRSRRRGVRRRVRRQGGLLHPPDRDCRQGAGLPDDEGGAVRAEVPDVFVYPADKYKDALALCERSSEYALTGAFFAQDRAAIAAASTTLRHAAGNFYINDKPTGAVVGQQPFGGSRASGTNDKAGQHAQPGAMDFPAHDQGELRRLAGPPLSVHGRGLRPILPRPRRWRPGQIVAPAGPLR